MAVMVTRDWLFAHYTLLGMDCVQIGGLVKRDPKTVWSWMKAAGVKTRPRGHNVGQLPQGRPSGFTLSDSHKQRLREARAADGRMPHMKDGKHWLHHEGAVHPNWKGGITPDRQALYLTAEWVTAVKIVWARDDAKCQRCGSHHNTAQKRGTFHVHHIVGFKAVALRAEPSNLALLCSTCHRFVHSRKNIDKSFIKDAP